MKTMLIAGLGNPGKKYEKTRHNAGFMLVDFFFENYKDHIGFSDWEFKKKLNAEVSVGKYKDIKIILLKPQTFMNLSGEAVKKVLKYYKIHLKIVSQDSISRKLVVAHDEIDLPIGKFKISVDSRAAGHNGVQNIIDVLGTKNFTRIRIGIDNRGDRKIDTEKYVLGKFTNAEMKTISKINSEILEICILSFKS